MSSKSRKHSSQPARGQTPHAGPPTGGAPDRKRADATDPEHAEPSVKDFLEAEELLKVPRGRSKATYVFLVFLLIFLTATFVIIDFLPYFRGRARSADAVEMSWQRPGVGLEQYGALDWQREMRQFELTLDFLQGGRANPDEAEIARLVVLDTLAQDAGVRITEEELAEQLRAIARSMGGVQQYEARIRGRRGLSVAEFEETVRRLLRVQRFQQYLGLIAAQPSPEAVQALWKERRKETSFDYVLVATDDFLDAARAEVPDDAALEAWFAERSESERLKYQGPARVRAELVGAPLDPETPPEFPALFAAYPDAEDVDAAERGRRYYDQYAYVRFPAPEGTEGVIYRPYEEVAERAAAEAKVHAAMQAWRADLESRIAAGDEVDLAAEAERLGLARVAPENARTQAEWREAGGLAGTYVASQLMRLDAGRLAPGVIVEAAGLTVARALEQVAPSIPPFAEIAERVRDEWVEERADELATAALEGVRAAALAAAGGAEGDEAEASATEVSAEAFAEAARAAGLEVGHRDWLDSGAPADADPDAAQPAHAILRTRTQVLALDPGQLSEPLTSVDGKHALLARMAGEREVPIERMQGADFQTYYDQAKQRVEFEWAFGQGPLAWEALRARYDIQLAAERRAAERAAQDALDAGDAAAGAEGS